MPNPTPEDIISLLEQLAERAEQETDQILEYLTHEDPAVREAAVWALWNGGLTRIADPLVERVEHDTDTLVQSAAVSVLGRYVYEGLMLDGDPDSPEARVISHVNTYLRAMFQDPQRSQLLRRRALEALAFNPDDEIMATIEEWAGSSDPLHRKSAAFAMGRVSSNKFSALLLKLLDDPSTRVQTEAIRSVGEQGIRKAVSMLTALARGPDRDVAREAIEALGQVGGGRAAKALRSLVKLDDPELADLAAELLEDLDGA